MTERSGERRVLEERRGHVEQDLLELAGQVDAGEIDEATAARLEAAYRAELAEMDEVLAGLAKQPEDHPEPGFGVSMRRAVIGTGALLVAFTIAIAFIGGDTVPSQQGAAEGVDPTPLGGSADGSLETMEQVVAANPDNVALRLAVADAYFQREQYSSALGHYLAVLEDGSPTAQEESVALGRVGWMAFITGQLDAADQYLTTSLEVDPGNVEGSLFLGFVRLFGFDDPDGAIPLLEDVLAYPDLGAELRAEVEDALDRARSQGGGS
jgi:tetratricopeptide (TPR) repeat protein